MSFPDFHPTVREWFRMELGTPTPPQQQGWPSIQAGRHTLIAAPTGSGKTLAAFLIAIDRILQMGSSLPDETQVLYVSPLKALSNDVQKNLQLPLTQMRELDPSLPDVRVLVRTGDTSARDRAKMWRLAPHILVTTPESLYLLLTSQNGRTMLRTVQTVIVDEIHALARDKRGAHLALSLERLESWVHSDSNRMSTPLQRIGLSATQKPIEEIARFLVGPDRHCDIVDVGHHRNFDVGVEIPRSPLATVCSHETWEEIYERMAGLIREHRTTLVFVNTRKLAERVAARLTRVMGEDQVGCHHGSLSRLRRLDAEQRLKQGKLSALVATASLELGIDIGEVDLVIQVGAIRSIANFLQRIGRSGHSLQRTPKGRIFPLTIDELVDSAALIRAVRQGELDRIEQPHQPLDILAQQVVAACVSESWAESELFNTVKRAWPYRDLSRADFDSVLRIHSEGRHGLLHRDGVGHRVMAKKRARIPALTSGGAIPDVADYSVVVEPDGTPVGTLNEDFAIESNAGDIFQLGNTSWRILKVEQGVVRVADAKGLPPTLPFWLGEAPGRTTELSAQVGQVREEASNLEWLTSECGLSSDAAQQVLDFLEAGRRVLGTVPTQQRIILERFFDEAGGMQLVIHSPFGSRINRAWGLALRKRFCRGFGFELQAAANEDAIVLSLGPQHSFELKGVIKYLKSQSAQDVLEQALLDSPMFESRWRWNTTRSLLVERSRNGKRMPAPIIRMRAADLLAAAFPHAVACPENLPGGSLPIPKEHPIVRQTIDDCLTEAMDIDGFLKLLRELESGRIECIALDTSEPSVFAHGILSAQPYSFLDDAPLEERRTQAVLTRRALDPRTSDTLGDLDAEAVRRVQEEAWPQPESAEEVHEALLWMGFVTEEEARPWRPWIDELAGAGRITLDDGRWFAVEATRDPKEVLRGRLEALGPVQADDPRHATLPSIGPWSETPLLGEFPTESRAGRNLESSDSVENLLHELELEGVAMRTRIQGRPFWCERRLLARIHRYTVERLRREIEPVTAADFLRFLSCWQHAAEESRLEGPRGVAEVLTQLAGFEVPASLWESSVLKTRVRDYRREWLDELTLSGEFVWGRLWGSSIHPVRRTPMALVPREVLDSWLSLVAPINRSDIRGPAHDILDALTTRGPLFMQQLQSTARLVPAHLEMGLAELISLGAVTCDSFSGVRQLITPMSRRKLAIKPTGRWSLFREGRLADGVLGVVKSAAHSESTVAFVAKTLLRRTGVVFRSTLLREKQPIPWYSLVRQLRRMELAGDVRGGRFVAGFSGEQFALPEAVEMLREVRRHPPRDQVEVVAADPLNFEGILTPKSVSGSGTAMAG